MTDAIVVGGGPAGCAVALRLLRLGRSVAVLERSGYDGTRLGEHLAPAGPVALAALVPDTAALLGPHRRGHGITMTWGDTEARHTDHLFEPHGPGYHLDRRRFDGDLAGAAARAGAEVLTSRRLTSITREGGGWLVTATGDRGSAVRLRARFLVDATGRAARLGRRLGARRRRFDLLIGIARTGPAVPAGGVRLVVASTETGWWYASVTTAGCLDAVFLTDVDLARRQSRTAGEVWRRNALRPALIRDLLPSPPPPALVVRPAGTAVLEPMAGDGWLAVGDAGVALDPLCGRGIVDALESGSRAGAAIDRALDGATAALDAFVQERRAGFGEYLAERRATYRLERRWPASAFWQRRHRSP